MQLADEPVVFVNFSTLYNHCNSDFYQSKAHGYISQFPEGPMKMMQSGITERQCNYKNGVKKKKQLKEQREKKEQEKEANRKQMTKYYNLFQPYHKI